jgi:hypothetical protein
MKKVRSAGSVAAKVIMCAAVLIFVSSLWTDDNPTGDLSQNIEVSAANGILKFHGRNETQYRDLRSGTAPLVSGSFLKTGNGSAEILLPDNSVLCLDANTEVQVGMYHNGTEIVQRSGRAGHIVEPQAGKGYVVLTPYFKARAVGTEYRTMVNYPVEGAVDIDWGEVDIIYSERDPSTGETRDVYGFVPQGHKIVWPPDPAVPERLHTGEHETFHASQTPPGRVVGQKTPPPAADAWTRRTRNLGQLMRNLRQRHARGLLNDSQYLQKLRDLIGLGPGVMPQRPLAPMGGLWIGGGDNFIVKFCVSGNTISAIHVVDEWLAQDKQTGEFSHLMVNYSLPQGVQFSCGEGGRVNDGFTIHEESIWKGVTVIFDGHIGSTTGTIFVDNYSETDVARYWGHCMMMNVRLVDPNGCNY